jgi:ArsR family transcriptional regulator
MNKPAPIQADPDDEGLARLCKALGHPARVAIMRHLLEIDGCVCGRIVEVLSLAQSTVSEHLRKLKAAGLVRGEVDGPRTCYCIDRQGMARLRELAAGLLPEGGGEAVEIGEDCPCVLDSGEEAS